MPKWNPLGRLVTEQKAAPPCQLKLPLLPRAAPVSLPLCASSRHRRTATGMHRQLEQGPLCLEKAKMPCFSPCAALFQAGCAGVAALWAAGKGTR